MVTRTRLNAPMAVAESEDDAARLKFNEPLSWRAGKPIPVADLQRRLKALSKELRELEQETFDRESLADVAKDLATSNLLAHKDQGVRAYTACCLADILRLCAPDAPYTASQLKVGQFTACRWLVLADPFLGDIFTFRERSPPCTF